jgi:hypothetical protein
MPSRVQETGRRIAARVLLIIGVVFLLVGSSGLAAAGVLAFRESHSGRAARAEGVIVSADYRAVIEFKAADGETVRFRNPTGSTFTTEGDHVPVAYDPANPRSAAVDSFVGRWFVPGLFTILFGVFFVVGTGLSLASWLLGRGAGVQPGPIVS